MLTIPSPSSQIGGSNYIWYGKPQPTISSSGSSLVPSDSISACLSPPWSKAWQSKSHVASHAAEMAPPDVPWTVVHQLHFEERLMHLTASVGLPLSWVENLEWLLFCTEFIPSAKSPSQKVLIWWLLPRTLTEFQSQAMQHAAGHNVTASCDGWTGENSHHYIALMVVIGKEVWYFVIISHCCQYHPCFRYIPSESMMHQGNVRQQITSFNSLLRSSSNFNHNGMLQLLPSLLMHQGSWERQGKCYSCIIHILYVQIAMLIRLVIVRLGIQPTWLRIFIKDQPCHWRLLCDWDSLYWAQQSGMWTYYLAI
jgi:hypothetical protein